MQKKKIAVLTGTRAEYGYIKRILKLMEKSSKLEYKLIVSGTHLVKEYGLTVNEIKKDGFKESAAVHIKADPKDPTSWSKAIGKVIIDIAETLDKIKPNLILIPGDPWLIFASAIAATYMRIPIAHIQGGEISGNVDGIVRHAITKLAHIHFVSNKNAAEIVRRLGEEEFRIFNVGGPMLDEVVHDEKIDPEILADELGFDLTKPIIIILQHPVSFEYKMAKKQIEKTMRAIEKLKLQTIIIYPNSEPGSKDMINVIEKYRTKNYVRIFPSLSRTKYLSMLKIASVLVGNSSSGIIEAPALKLPVVNIGTRQIGRIRSENVIDVDYNDDKILHAIKKAVDDKEFKNIIKYCASPYGDGKSSERIVKILEDLKIDELLLNKNLTFTS
jgi:GDP/UDP-N,N'-diacetylbacillosamine 2-epimerase (hydrolysing)